MAGQVRQMRGPGMRGVGPRPHVENPMKVVKRILGYVLKDYKFHFILVVICIIGSALMTLRGTLFTQSLIDDYILPLTQSPDPDFSGLAHALMLLAVTYAIGILCSYV